MMKELAASDQQLPPPGRGRTGEGVENQAAQLQLADIHLPAQPSAWPLAWGWWVLLALLLVLIGLVVKKIIRYKKLRKHQQQIQGALTELEKQLYQADQANSSKAIAEMNILLRRLALMHYPRQQIASLTGSEWLVFLDRSGQTNDFTQGAGRLLADTPYLAEIPASADLKGLVKVIRKWVKQVSSQSESTSGNRRGARV